MEGFACGGSALSDRLGVWLVPGVIGKFSGFRTDNLLDNLPKGNFTREQAVDVCDRMETISLRTGSIQWRGLVGGPGGAQSSTITADLT